MPVVKDSYGLPTIIRPASPHQKSGASGNAINSMMPDADRPNSQGREAYAKDTTAGYRKGGLVKKKPAPAPAVNRYAKKRK